MMRLGLRHRPLLLVGLGVLLAGVLIGRFGCGLHWRSAVLLGWCLGAGCHALLLVRDLMRSSPALMRDRAALLDDSRWTVLGFGLAAALAALVGVVWQIGSAGPESPEALPLGLATVIISWGFLQLLFGHHYAHEYWLSGGLDFPGGDDHPDGLEFLYFALTVGMTCQVSDVTTNTPAMRRIVLMHGVMAFVFNAAVVAGAVNLVSGLAAR